MKIARNVVEKGNRLAQHALMVLRFRMVSAKEEEFFKLTAITLVSLVVLMLHQLSV